MTEQELRVFLERDAASYPVNWLVEAGAGAGKTHLIVQRMANQLAGGFCAPDQLVAITFTNKATAQLRDRLVGELLARQRAAATPGEAAHLADLAGRADEIQISTVHSFCQRMLGEMPLQAGLGFASSMLDEEDTLRYYDRFFSDCQSDHPEWFAPLKGLGVDPDSLRDAFVRLLVSGDAQQVRIPAASPEFDALAARGVADAERERLALTAPFPPAPDAPRTPWLAQLLGMPAIENPAQLALWAHRIETFANTRNRRGCSVTAVYFEEGAARKIDLQKLIADADCPAMRAWNDWAAHNQAAMQCEKEIQKLRGRARPTAKSAEKLAEAEASLGAHRAAMRALESADEHAFVCACIRLALRLKEVSVLVRARDEIFHAAALDALLRCREALEQDKQARGLVSFDNLLTRTRNLLRDSAEARSRFGGRWRVIYVDEFQDTDPVQAQLLFYLTAERFDRDWTKCVPRAGSLFLVGDAKQSIYRFRRADIEVYEQVRGLFAKGGAGRVAQLQFNYRSTEALCRYATEIFRPVMTGTAYQAAFLEMHSPVGAAAPGSGAYSFALQDRKAAPAAVAAFIEASVRSGQAAFGDFMVLCRTKNQVEAYRAALRERSIPVNASGRHALRETAPIARCADWCDFLLHGQNPVAALRVLDGQGVTPAQLYALQQQTGRSLHELRFATTEELDALLPLLDDALRPAVRTLQRMRRIQGLAGSLAPVSLLEELFRGDYGLWTDETRLEDLGWVCQYLARLRRFPDQSLHGLLRKALALSNSSLERQMDAGAEPPVQVMNLHKAKGLEARVVFLAPGAVRPPAAMQHMRRGKCWLCVRGMYTAPDGQSAPFVATPPDWRNACAEEAAFASAEGDRLLYVAATRARELLLIGREAEKADEAWGLLACPALDPDGPSPLPDWPVSSLFSPEDTPRLLKPPTARTPDDTEDARLKQTLHALPAAPRCAVTPSRLGHPEPPVRTEEEEAGEWQPRGADWGTIVHRTLELAVNRRAWEEEALAPLAAQAVEETLAGQPLAPDECLRLCGRGDADRAELTQRLARTAVRQCAVLLRGASPLRCVLARGQAVTEYPFSLTLCDPGDPLYLHVAKHLPGDPPRGRPVDLQGVIDLAVRTPDGWIVVDYKTDRPLPGEGGDAYAARLKAAYTPQIRVYAQILRRMTPGADVSAYLCAVSQNGRLIELTVKPRAEQR